MLDMGFEAQIAEVSRSMSSDRQTLFFSATWPKDVRDAAATFAKRRAVRLFIGDVQVGVFRGLAKLTVHPNREITLAKHVT